MTELLRFWMDCLDRRLIQYGKHVETLAELQNYARANSSLGEFQAAIWVQQELCNDARKKIDHAERMVTFFERRK